MAERLRRQGRRILRAIWIAARLTVGIALAFGVGIGGSMWLAELAQSIGNWIIIVVMGGVFFLAVALFDYFMGS